MFRISQYMKVLHQGLPLAPKRSPKGPVVIWNLVRRCNLTCRHCYSISADVDFPGELSTAQALANIDDLKAMGVPALILSGGEPLLRHDIFALSQYAKSLGMGRRGAKRAGPLRSIGLRTKSWNLPCVDRGRAAVPIVS